MFSEKAATLVTSCGISAPIRKSNTKSAVTTASTTDSDQRLGPTFIFFSSLLENRFASGFSMYAKTIPRKITLKFPRNPLTADITVLKLVSST